MGSTLKGRQASNKSIIASNQHYVEDAVVDLSQIPNLNGKGRFLGGGSVSGKEEDHMLQDHVHGQSGGSILAAVSIGRRYADCQLTVKNTGLLTTIPKLGSHGTETRPINMSVVWIIRVK